MQASTARTCPRSQLRRSQPAPRGGRCRAVARAACPLRRRTASPPPPRCLRRRRSSTCTARCRR
eukprot:scaffold3450_cov323-Prasinococcus_capsulatus_cf.AAC.4